MERNPLIFYEYNESMIHFPILLKMKTKHVLRFPILFFNANITFFLSKLKQNKVLGMRTASTSIFHVI